MTRDGGSTQESLYKQPMNDTVYRYTPQIHMTMCVCVCVVSGSPVVVALFKDKIMVNCSTNTYIMGWPHYTNPTNKQSSRYIPVNLETER